MVGYPHDIKGQGIYCYVTLNAGEEPIGGAAQGAGRSTCAARSGRSRRPTLVQFAPGLPKTRSGKIMRRILRKIAEDEFGEPRRYVDAGGPGGGRRPDREPTEPQGELVPTSVF